MSTIYKEAFTEYDKCLKNYIDKIMWDNLDLVSYGVSWKPNVKDPHLTRVGNTTYHKTLPIQNNIRGCIALMKDNFRIIYYLNSQDWRWHAEEDKSQNTLKSLPLTVTDGVYTLTHSVFKDLRFEKLYVKVNNIICEISSIDIATKTATLNPQSDIEAGTYDVELGAVLNGYDGEVMVEIPEFWIKSWDTDIRREVRITPIKIDSTWEYLPRILISAYHNTVLNTIPENMGYLSTLEVNSAVSVTNTNSYCRGGDNSSIYDTYIITDKFRSMLGKPRTNISRATMRNYARKAGKEVLNYLQYKRILYWLYVIEYANFNCKETFNANLTSDGYHQGGMGSGVTITNYYLVYYNNYNPLTPNGYTNEFGNSTNIKAMTIVMPTTNGGDPTYSITQYVPRWHGIENLFGDIWDNIEGIFINSSSIVEDEKNYSEIYATEDATLYNDSNYKGMKRVGIELNESGYIKEWNLGDTAEIIPRLHGGNLTQYKCDKHLTSDLTGSKALLIGGDSRNGAGLGGFHSLYGVSGIWPNVGFRTSYIIK